MSNFVKVTTAPFQYGNKKHSPVETIYLNRDLIGEMRVVECSPYCVTHDHKYTSIRMSYDTDDIAVCEMPAYIMGE